MRANAQLKSRPHGAVPTGAVSSLDSLTSKSSSRIKQQVAMIRPKLYLFTCPTPYPKGTSDLSRRWWEPTVFGMDVLSWPQIDPTVLDFQISLSLCHDGTQSVEFGSANWRKLRVLSLILGAHVNTSTAHNYFRYITCVVWQSFCEKRFRDVEKSVSAKKIFFKPTLSLNRYRYTGDCNKLIRSNSFFLFTVLQWHM